MRQPGKRAQRLQLRAEHERAVVPRVVERLDAEVVAREEELAAAAVPQREREHAGEPVEQSAPHAFQPWTSTSPSPCVREHVAGRRELAPQRAEVVDLAVEDDGDRAVGGHERLPAAGEVDHRQPAMAESDRAVEVKAVGVGAAMRERRGHRGQRVARAGIVGEVAGDAAHGAEVAKAGRDGRGSGRAAAVRPIKRLANGDDYSPRSRAARVESEQPLRHRIRRQRRDRADGARGDVARALAGVEQPLACARRARRRRSASQIQPASCATTSSPAPQRRLVTTGRPQASASSTAFDSGS